MRIFTQKKQWASRVYFLCSSGNILEYGAWSNACSEFTSACGFGENKDGGAPFPEIYINEDGLAGKFGRNDIVSSFLPSERNHLLGQILNTSSMRAEGIIASQMRV